MSNSLLSLLIHVKRVARVVEFHIGEGEYVWLWMISNSVLEEIDREEIKTSVFGRELVLLECFLYEGQTRLWNWPLHHHFRLHDGGSRRNRSILITGYH